MQAEADIATIARAIQLAVTPVFLLLGIGTMLAVMTSRLARVVDRARVLQRQVGASVEQHDPALVRESRTLALRGRLASTSIALLTTAALLIAAVIAILFSSAFLPWNMARLVAVLFIAAMLAVFLGLVLFLREVFLATAALRLGLDHGNRPGPGGGGRA